MSQDMQSWIKMLGFEVSVDNTLMLSRAVKS
jgi:hypothetical protein